MDAKREGWREPTSFNLTAGVAQLVERLICNQLVRGSSPLPGLTKKDIHDPLPSTIPPPRQHAYGA